MKPHQLWTGLSVALCLGWSALSVAAAEPAVPDKASAEPLFARVNGKDILQQEYEALFTATLRQRFYHGNIPEGQTEVVRKEVADLVIERALLLSEAEHRGLKPDAAKIDQAVAGYEKRYANSPMWQQQREQLLPGLKAQLAQQDLLEQMDKVLREVSVPSADEVRVYYDQHQDLFTEPEKLHLSVILLKVDPSANDETWKQTRQKAQDILQAIKAGADFAEQARANSQDVSAANGGDLGYVHRGMLPEAMQAEIDQAKIGEAAGPLTVLEGVALYRLEKKVAPQLRAFADVEPRVRELLLREKRDAAKKAALARLHEAAKIEILASGKQEQK